MDVVMACLAKEASKSGNKRDTKMKRLKREHDKKWE